MEGILTGDEPTGDAEESLGIVSFENEGKSSVFFLRRERRLEDDEGLPLRSIAVEDEGDEEDEGD